MAIMTDAEMALLLLKAFAIGACMGAMLVITFVNRKRVD